MKLREQLFLLIICSDAKNILNRVNISPTFHIPKKRFSNLYCIFIYRPIRELLSTKSTIIGVVENILSQKFERSAAASCEYLFRFRFLRFKKVEPKIQSLYICI